MKFYVLYITPKELSEKIDAIRFLLNPKEKRAAHLTVRGPYHKKSIGAGVREKSDDLLDGTEIRVTGFGSFLFPDQNTVFLQCESDIMSEIWWKPDFKDAHPHITLYDGKRRDLADALIAMLKPLDLSFSFRPSRLVEIHSVKGQYDMEPLFNLKNPIITSLMGPDVSIDELEALTTDQRLDLVAKSLNLLADEAKGSSAPTTSSPIKKPALTVKPPILGFAHS